MKKPAPRCRCGGFCSPARPASPRLLRRIIWRLRRSRSGAPPRYGGKTARSSRFQVENDGLQSHRQVGPRLYKWRPAGLAFGTGHDAGLADGGYDGFQRFSASRRRPAWCARYGISIGQNLYTPAGHRHQCTDLERSSLCGVALCRILPCNTSIRAATSRCGWTPCNSTSEWLDLRPAANSCRNNFHHLIGPLQRRTAGPTSFTTSPTLDLTFERQWRDRTPRVHRGPQARGVDFVPRIGCRNRQCRHFCQRRRHLPDRQGFAQRLRTLPFAARRCPGSGLLRRQKRASPGTSSPVSTAEVWGAQYVPAGQSRRPEPEA